MSFLDPTSIAA